MRSVFILAGFVAAAAAGVIENPGLLRRQANISTDGTCGPDFGSQTCPDGECCSEYGYCGTGVEFCAAPGCQTGFSAEGACLADTTPPAPSTENVPRPRLGNVPYGTVINDCITPGVVALTFDDGPYIYTSKLLDILANNSVKVTFFMNGNNGGGGPIYEQGSPYPDLLKRMHAEGHMLASHTWSHADLNAQTLDNLNSEVTKNEGAFSLMVGFIPTYFRPPYGNCNATCQSVLSKYGYHIIDWNVDTLDWEVGAVVGAKNFDSGITAARDSSTGVISLAHDIHQTTVESLAQHMIDSAKAAGYKLVTVGECLGDPRTNWYRNTQDGGSWNPNAGASESNSALASSSASAAASSSASAVASSFASSVASSSATAAASSSASTSASSSATAAASNPGSDSSSSSVSATSKSASAAASSSATASASGIVSAASSSAATASSTVSAASSSAAAASSIASTSSKSASAAASSSVSAALSSASTASKSASAAASSPISAAVSSVSCATSVASAMASSFASAAISSKPVSALPSTSAVLSALTTTSAIRSLSTTTSVKPLSISSTTSLVRTTTPAPSPTPQQETSSSYGIHLDLLSWWRRIFGIFKRDAPAASAPSARNRTAITRKKGFFGAPDSHGVYYPGYKSPNSTTIIT